MKSSRRLQLVFSLLISFAAGGIGQIFTYKEITTWYAHLQKPSFNPPNYLFGPVWTLLYILMGISLFLALGKTNSILKKWGLIFFFVQLILNALWTLIFFGAHAPLFAFGDILMMVLFTILTIIWFWKISKPSAFLLIPYLLWIGFASVLNFFVIILNK